MNSNEHEAKIDQILNQRALLDGAGRLKEIVPLDAELVSHYRRIGDMHGLAWALARQASILRRLGRLDAAESILSEQERICLAAPPRLGFSCARAQSLRLQA